MLYNLSDHVLFDSAVLIMNENIKITVRVNDSSRVKGFDSLLSCLLQRQFQATAPQLTAAKLCNNTRSAPSQLLESLFLVSAHAPQVT